MDNDADRETNQEFKRARVLAAEQHIIQQRTNSVATQIRLFNENRDAFIAIHDEETYARAIVGLLNSFPQPSRRIVDGNGTSSVAWGSESLEGSSSDGIY